MTSCMTWPVPAAGPERDRLAGAIGRLAVEHAAPVFAPHVTLVGAFDASQDAVGRGLGFPPRRGRVFCIAVRETAGYAAG
jgi:hypothetical protein